MGRVHGISAYKEKRDLAVWWSFHQWTRTHLAGHRLRDIYAGFWKCKCVPKIKCKLISVPLL